MESKPLVTVITPTYNREKFLRYAIDSVLAQTIPDFELIVVDDGSTDNSWKILEEYKVKDNRIRTFWQENQGQSVARNRGLAESRGQYLCFIDSDNAWEADKLERQLTFMDENSDVDVVYGDIITIDEHSHEIGRDNMARFSGRITGKLLRDNFVSINTSMVRRYCFDQMGGFNERDRLAEDYDLWLRYSTRFNFRYLPGYFAYYRVMADQISSDKTARFWANERTLQKFLDTFPDSVSLLEKRRGWSAFCARRSRYLNSTGQQQAAALTDALRSIAHWPFQSTGWRALFRVAVPGPLRDN